MALLETRDAKLRTVEWLRKQAELLSNLGNLHGAGAEDAFRQSIALSESLVTGKDPRAAVADRVAAGAHPALRAVRK